MKSSEIVESLAEFKEYKNIDRPTMMKVLEDMFKTLIRKKYGSDENFDVIANDNRGEIEIYRRREIVKDGEVTDPNAQIALSEAHKIDASLEIGEEAYETIDSDEFGRRSVLAARQTLISKVMELEKDELYKKYKDRVGDVITGEVYQIWKKELLVHDEDGNELVLPKDQLIKADYYKKGEPLKAVVQKVDLRNNNPVIILSRTDNNFLAKLMEMEVPEIFDGIIVIRKIVRQPGERAKVAVESFDDRIDPVGACVGMKGSRIHGIVRELKNENIDIINYTSNNALFVQRCLTPAKINRIEVDDEQKRASVFLDPEQVSLAIGKGGVNIKLAGKIAGYEINVFRDIEEEDYYDIELEEFADEIDMWIIKILKGIGCDSAKSVLDISRNELIRRTDLEEETIDDVLRILRAEFDDEILDSGS